MNLNDYDQFHFSIKSEFTISKLLDNYDVKSLLYALFKLKIFLKSTWKNTNYLINAIKDAVKLVKLKDIQLLDTIENMILLFNLGKALSKINIDLKSKVIIDEIFYFLDEQKMNQEFLKLIKDMKEECKAIKTDLISEGLYYPFKSINIDNISFYLGNPKFKSGLSLIFKNIGLTEFVS